jgi:DNA-binding response OmpR family regulator
MSKILVIEDELAVLENIKMILTFENFDVITASNGEDGITQAIKRTPDLIICDIMMPAIDGYGVVKAVRSHPDTRTVPFIFLTAKAEPVDCRNGMNSGADDYLTKPFTPQEIVAAVNARLRRQAEIRSTAVDRISQELREPLSNINLALHMLQRSESDEERSRYLNILREEYAREMRLLSEMDQLQALLPYSNIAVLKKFNLLS